MSYAILKLSYNTVGGRTVEGGICGTAFFITQLKAITAHHVINSKSICPNTGFEKCQFWLLSRSGHIIELLDFTLSGYPDVDTTVINFSQRTDGKFFEIARNPPVLNSQVHNEGYIGNQMPFIDYTWTQQKGFVINRFDLTNIIADQRGYIKNIIKLSMKSNDVNFEDKTVFETSYPGVVGMSGGPLIDTATNQVIGLMSFGLPADKLIKKSLAAISIKEVMEHIEPGRSGRAKSRNPTFL